ncbi:hypothetical protein PG993_002535 [Apiospora rasikravindrae]|uniref:Aminoglycoside phosphotransferase domain-containing protein n=1 Tax=Apiospora rasikravindrae TaxID=990691 RepID=A0ABR1TWW9_9PEZI
MMMVSNRVNRETAKNLFVTNDLSYPDENSLFVPKRRKIASAIVIDDNDEIGVKEEKPPETNLIPGSASPEGDERLPHADDEALKPSAKKSSPPTTERKALVPAPSIEKVEKATPTTNEADNLVLGDQARADPNGLTNGVAPSSPAAIADQPEVGDGVDRARSRSIETDRSLFGSPTRDDEKIPSPEPEQLSGEKQLSPEQPSAGDLDVEDVEEADAVSISSSKSIQTYAQIGVEWKTKEFDYFNPYPAWSCEPEAHEVVELLKEVVSPLVEYNVKFLHKSSFNRFFEVEWDNQYYVLKLTLPICPVRKTQSEVATMRWAKAMTALPVPDVVQNLYSTSADNPVGCEWILMRKVPGRPLFQCWNDMDMPRKRRLVEQLAEYTVRVFDNEFEGIGSLYPPAPGDPDPRPELKGVQATMPFFWNGRYDEHRQRGPYETYREWAFDRLDLACADAEAVLPKLENINIRKIPWRIQALVAKLKELHDVLFPSSSTPAPATEEKKEEEEEELKGGTKDEPIDLLSNSEDDSEATLANPDAGDSNDNNVFVPFDAEEKCMMWHSNLSMDNIFVDETGVITGVLDWECVSAIPRSVGCQLPALLLEGHNRFHEPRIQDYWTFSDTLPSRSPSPSPDDDSENYENGEPRGRPRHRRRRHPQVGPTPAYWQARREWELTDLRRHFLMTMSERSLGWHMCHKHHALKRDFETAVQYCDEPVLLDTVEAWVRDVERALRRKRKINEAAGGEARKMVRGAGGLELGEAGFSGEEGAGWAESASVVGRGGVKRTIWSCNRLGWNQLAHPLGEFRKQNEGRASYLFQEVGSFVRT